MKKSIKILAYSILAVVIFILTNFIYNKIVDNNKIVNNKDTVEQAIEIYNNEKSVDNLILLCDVLETYNDIRIIDYLDEALKIDNELIVEKVPQLYASNEEYLNMVQEMGPEVYKGQWLSTALVLCANKGDMATYKQLFLKYLPEIHYEYRMLAFASSFTKYENTFLTDNIEIIVEMLQQLYEGSDNDFDKVKYLSMVASLYTHDESTHDKAKQCLEQMSNIVINTKEDKELLQDLTNDYAVDCRYWSAILTYIIDGEIIYEY